MLESENENVLSHFQLSPSSVSEINMILLKSMNCSYLLWYGTTAGILILTLLIIHRSLE